ncbi:MAG: hypothetical protein ACRDTN_13470 [Mycobacterium sp.]
MQRETVRTTDTQTAALRRARTCYDHLAGRLGVAVLTALVEQGALVRPAAPEHTHAYLLGPEAAPVFGRLGVDLDALLTRPATARPLLRFCVDWSEHRHHLAGALGAAVLARAETARWVVRRPTGRAVDVTDAGRRAFRDILGIRAAAASPSPARPQKVGQVL